MNKTILLAVDAARHVQAAVEMTRELSRDSGDKVVVVHVHEIAVGRFGRIRVDCAEGEGEKLVASITDDLRAAGIDAAERRPGRRLRPPEPEDPGHRRRTTTRGSSCSARAAAPTCRTCRWAACRTGCCTPRTGRC